MDRTALRHASVLAALSVVAATWLGVLVPVGATPPTFSSLSPNGGEVLTGDATFGIRWTVSHDNDSFAYTTIRYSLNGGATFPYFVTAEPFPTGGAVHGWRVPAWNSTSARVRVCATAPDGGANCTASARDFTILHQSPTIALLSPSDGARNVPLGERIVIAFSPSVDPGNVTWTITPMMTFVPTWSGGNTLLTLTSANALPECTTFGLSVNAGDGRQRSWSFRTLCPAPAVTQTSPANGQVNVGLMDPVVVAFAGPMNPQSVTLTVAPTTLMSASWSQNYTVATFSHAVPFIPCTTYMGMVQGSDPYGNALSTGTPPTPGAPNPWSFTTNCSTTGYVRLLSPTGGERWTGGTSQTIAWEQSLPSGGSMDWNLSWRSAPNDPWAFLANGTAGSGTQTYDWTVPTVDTGSAQVRVCVLSAGNPVCDTGGAFAIDSTSPILVSHEPPDGAAGVPLDLAIVATFSEPMNRTGTEAGFAITPTVAMLGYDWSANDTVLSVRLDTLAPSTAYVWAIGCTARDRSDPGNVLFGCQEVHSFTTQNATYLRLTSPLGGESWTGGSDHAVTFTITNGGAKDEAFNVTATYRHENSTQGGTIGSTVLTVPARGTVRGQFDWVVPPVDATDAVVNITAGGANATLADQSAPFEIDSTPPTVLSFGPSGPAVPLDPTVSVAFSEPMAVPPDPPLSVRGPPGAPTVTWTLAWSPARDAFDAALQGTRPCTAYDVGVGADPTSPLRDDSDPGNVLAPLNWTFTTICVPSVTLLSPVGGEDWTGGSVHDIRWTTEDGDDATLDATLSSSVDGGATFAPLADLVVDVGPGSFPWTLPRIDSAEVVVRIVVTDAAGNTASAQGGPFTVDSTPPELLVSFPSDGAAGHKTTRDIWFVFTERVDRPSFESAFSLAPNPGGLGFLWSVSNLGGDVLVVEHSPFKSKTSYTATFATTARDDSDPGNPLAASIVVRFSTQPPPPVNPPVAKAVGKNQVRAGEPVALDGTGSTGDLVRYVWRILDNQQRFVAVLTGEMATYTFQHHGRYSVTLIVTDATDAVAEDTIEINVTSNPDAGILLGTGILLVAALGAAATEAGKYSLFGWILFPLYARRRRNELLEHETRGMIFGYVLVHPGDTYSDIKRNLRLTNGTLSYHLRVLEREGLVRSQTRGAHKHFFPAGAHMPEDGGGLHEVQIRMLRAVRELPGLAVKDLAGALGITSQHALYHLRSLAASGHVRLERRGIRLRCYPAERPSPQGATVK